MAKNKNFPGLLRPLLLSMTLVLLLHFALRMLFWTWNRSLFASASGGGILRILYWGLKMDLSGLALLNIPVFIFLFVAQYPGHRSKIFLKFASTLFVVLNALGLALNIIDTGYFPFVKHRMNADLIYVLSDSAGSFGFIAKNYWFLIFIFILSLWILIYFSKRIFVHRPMQLKWQTTFFFQAVALCLLLLLIRGWEARPLIPASPLLEVDARNLPLAQNSINSFLYSVLRKKDQLSPKNYFSQDQMEQLASSTHYCCTDTSLTDTPAKKNVVICILESFSRFYLAEGDPHKANTPFFDSLIKKSIYFPNAFANGFTSNQGIVAILGGLPGLLDEPFYYSDYANTPLKSIGNILREKGYDTNFFMGAGEDHFGFGKLCHMAGIDHYYSRKNFNHDEFYDGSWGIYDEPFFQYGAQVLGQKKQPFFAVFFNLSSHPPFTLPDKYRNSFNFPGSSPAERSISYVDYAFRQFFETCEKSSWFDNSIFVFCADHFLDPNDGRSYTPVTYSMIPIFIYDPSRQKGMVDTTLISQVDITPAVLDLLHYRGKYAGFGTDIFDPSVKENYAINKPGAIYQLITNEFVLGYDLSSEKTKYLYRYAQDSLWKNNLADNGSWMDTQKRLEMILKANIQSYAQALLRRSLDR